MNIIEIEDLCHRFADGTSGLQHVSLTIRRGEFAVLAGPNGSGKTTLLKHLNGLLLAHSGTVRVGGIPVDRDPVGVRQMVGMVFQDADSQIVGETVYEDVAFGPENLLLSAQEVDRRVKQSLAAVELQVSVDQSPHTLSGGEKRRLAIAGVLAMAPQVIVLDEPFSDLDYPATVQVLKQILNLHRNGHTVLLTTHDLEKVIAHADRLILLRDGRVARSDLPANLLKETEAFGVRAPCATRMGLEVESWLS